jgi:OmpA-OmpF porin, OOP family
MVINLTVNIIIKGVYMKKILLFATAVLLLFANTALADSIAGKVGVTARGGASYIFNSEFTVEGLASFASGGVIAEKDIKPGIGWTGGLGIMYGITDNLAVNFDALYLQVNVKGKSDVTGEITLGTGKTIDFALGAQWRFMPQSRFVPYVGAGLDVLVNRFSVDDQFAAISGSTSGLDVATTFGGHLSVGGDFFITPNIALNAEIRGLLSTTGDMKDDTGFVPAKYNPSNISGFIGLRYFFGGAKEASQPIAKAEPAPPPVEEMKKAPEAAAKVEQEIIEKGRVTMNVEFDTGKNVIKPASYKEIESVVDVLKKYPNLKIVVEGHTDNIGGEKFNNNLSQKRADAVKEVMVKNYQIDSSRITAKGFGYSKSIGDNKTKEGRQMNRRVEAAVEYEYKVKK